MGVLSGVDSDVWISAAPSLSATNESCTDSGDHITYTTSVHTFWDKTQTLTVQCSPNGSSGWATVTDYTFKYAAGQIVFNTARVVATNNFVRVSAGSYFTVTQLDASHKWTLSLKGATAKTTSFQSTGAWETNTATIKGATGTIETWRNDSRMFTELNSSTNFVMFQLFISKTSNIRWQFAGKITGLDPSADAQNMQAQKLTFIAENDIFLLTS